MKKINISMPEKSFDRLTSLKDRLSYDTEAEVISMAFRILESLVDHHAAGSAFQGISKSGEIFAADFGIIVRTKGPKLTVVK